MFRLVVFLMVSHIVLIQGHGGGNSKGCSDASYTCPCGEQCVEMTGSDLCSDADHHCRCVSGCEVYGMFIKELKSRDVFGNQCDCYFPELSAGIPSCDRITWRKAPKIPKYKDNPKCR